jgi:Raf kinase inhibitor-like YbhB/YbcL family protein
VAKQMLTWPESKRLLTVPGVNLVAAATFLAAVGDIARFRNSRRLVAYLGLDPRVRQSGDQPARSGSISKRGSVSARWALVEATWSVVNQPGPLRAFYLRIRSRRGHGKAIVATARKLAVLCWCMLTRGQDYAHQQPSLTAQKLRRLELAAGAPVRKGKPSGVWVTHQKMRHAEKQLAAQAQASYERTVRDWKAAVLVGSAGGHALLVDDPDAPVGTFTPWLAWGLDPGTEGLAEDGAAPVEGRNDFGSNGYRGPCPPPGHGPHRYCFRLYALDSALDLPAGTGKRELERALEGHTLAAAELVGTYER